jgi:hypothetical protein
MQRQEQILVLVLDAEQEILLKLLVLAGATGPPEHQLIHYQDMSG